MNDIMIIVDGSCYADIIFRKKGLNVLSMSRK